MTAKNKSIIQIVLVMLIWGSSFTITKIAVEQLPPNIFAFIRFIIASCILGLIFIIKKDKIRKLDKTKWLIIVAQALTGVTFYYMLFNTSLVHTSASVGALIQGFIPVAIAILAAVFLKEKLSALQVAGIFISLIGVVLIGFLNSSGEGNTWFGNLLMIGAVLCWAIYTILSKKLADLNALFLTTIITVLGTAFFIPFVMYGLADKSFPNLSLMHWCIIVYLGALPSALAYIWYNAALKHLSAVQVGAFLNLDPVMGAVIAVIFLKESITTYQIIGVVLVLGGVLISTMWQKKNAKAVID